MKIFEKVKLLCEREFKLFGLTILQYGIGSEKYVKIFPRKSFMSHFFDRLIDENKNTNGFYLIKHALGESYIFSTFVKSLTKKYKIKEPVIVGTRAYHPSLFKILLPEIKCCYSDDFRQYVTVIDSQKIYKYRDCLFFIYTPREFLRKNIYKKEHYFNSILKDYCDIFADEAELPVINISEEKRNDMFGKVSKTGLNFNKFVFLSPEAVTFKPLNDSFWENLVLKFKRNGYDIFVNITKATAVSYGKTCFLDLEEAHALVTMSKGVVGLRSGFLETLLPLDIQIHSIITDISGHDIVFDTYTIKGLPCFNEKNIFEYDARMVSTDVIFEKILNSFKL